MANNAVGEIVCPICKGVDEVRKNAKDKLYIYCEKFGIIQPARPAFQDWIRERTRFIESGESAPPGQTSDKPEPAEEWQPEEAQQQKAAAAATPEREAPKAAPKRRDVFKSIVNVFTEEG